MVGVVDVVAVDEGVEGLDGARRRLDPGEVGAGPLPEEVRTACDAVVRVPIYGRAESLNLAMAATVCLYGSARAQRDRAVPRS